MNPTTVRLSDIARQRLDALCQFYGESQSDVIRRLIEREWQQVGKHAQMIADYAAQVRREAESHREETRTMDRVQQVNWIEELAQNIAQNLGDGTAEELVEYALSDEGRESWGIELPDWFDDHDRSLLIRTVERALNE